MKLSEAARKAVNENPNVKKGVGRLLDVREGSLARFCFLGAALVGTVGLEQALAENQKVGEESYELLFDLYPELKGTGMNASGGSKFYWYVTGLNDCRDMSILEIADELESQGL